MITTTHTQPIVLDGLPSGAMVAVAMSGGVDSCVAAVMMVEAGYRVVGITLQLYDHGAMAQKKGSCCAGQDIYDARQVADQWNFPHYVLDYESLFKTQVIDDFVESYLHGETPVPCIRCNQQVKFKDLLVSAQDLGAQALITGHYVKRMGSPPYAELHRAVDHGRDQSYFLFTTTQAQLNYLRFPLGGMSKPETRAHAQRLGLAIAEKPDSQDICFVPSGGYASVIAKLRPGALEAGEIVHINGRVMGTHEGIINYTIGQRRGLGGGTAEALFVVRLEPETHRVIVGPYEALAQSKLILKEVNWLSPAEAFITAQPIHVKFRSTHDPVAASLRTLGNKQAEVTFWEPEYGIASGQACVFYEGSRILGGGWICA